jgi:RimJ/RimL family protein N-acetyltransferase
MQALLETERLALRRFMVADLDNLVALDSDPDVMRYLNGGAPTPRDVIERDILPGFLRSYEPCEPCEPCEPYDSCEGFGVWAVIERVSGDFLGWLSFLPSEGDPRVVALGYRLRTPAWGKGYATEAARALIRKGFRELGVQRVVATTYQDNRASRRVMEKVGMSLVRTFRYTPDELAAASATFVPGQELWDGDDVEYALERADWERRES